MYEAAHNIASRKLRMKYFILLGDGMSDLPISELNGKTPLQASNIPTADFLCANSICGMVKTVPDGMEPGSGPANMAVMGYDPSKYYTGRSPLEAVSLGIQMAPEDIVFRCNLVSLLSSSDKKEYRNAMMLDYSSGEITTAEAAKLISSIQTNLSSDDTTFYAGRSYRHCLVWKNGPTEATLTPPHDISGKCIETYLPTGERADQIISLMTQSVDVLKNHPVNISRKERGLHTADSIWLWGQGSRPSLPSFKSLYGRKGAVISAVDLIFGIGMCAGLQTIEVEGATGTLATNYKGKADAAIQAFSTGMDYVYLHVEAPDECGHHADIYGKIEAIENIDKYVLLPVYNHLLAEKERTGEDFRILFLPDHPTPISLRTHTSEAVPFLLYRSDSTVSSVASSYSEFSASQTGVHFSTGPALFEEFIRH